MLDAPLAPYLLWAKTRQPAAIDLAGSNLLACTIDDLPDVRETVDLAAPNDNGFAPVIEAIAARYGVGTDRVAAAQGCSGANFLTVAALVAPGDEVLVEKPTYDPLLGACRLMGARILRFERRFEDGYALDLDAIRRTITPRTRLIIVTTPHNPSGVSIDRAAMRELGAIADRHGATVLADEVYLDGANLVDGAPQRLPAATLDGPFVSTASLTKSFGLAGLRSGWVVAPADVAFRVRRTRDVVDNASSGPADRLAGLAWSHIGTLAVRAGRLLSRNVATMRAFLDAHPRLRVAAPPAASVVFPRLDGVGDAGPFVRRLVQEHGVAVAPGDFFDSPAHFRISLAGDGDTLERGLAEMEKALAAV
ncbi:MAG TPA: pyridoxal phosphate-dependent aminotransferase [Vicinamibacterales bacterium]|nr:pyridoxal phosphate-dependent aminotransferase [Vicinamibacterales bacterium]